MYRGVGAARSRETTEGGEYRQNFLDQKKSDYTKTIETRGRKSNDSISLHFKEVKSKAITTRVKSAIE